MRKILEVHLTEPQTGYENVLYFLDLSDAAIWLDHCRKYGIVTEATQRVAVSDEEARELCEETVH